MVGEGLASCDFFSQPLPLQDEVIDGGKVCRSCHLWSSTHFLQYPDCIIRTRDRKVHHEPCTVNSELEAWYVFRNKNKLPTSYLVTSFF